MHASISANEIGIKIAEKKNCKKSLIDNSETDSS